MTLSLVRTKEPQGRGLSSMLSKCIVAAAPYLSRYSLQVVVEHVSSLTIDCFWIWQSSLLGPLWPLCVCLFVRSSDIHESVDKTSSLWTTWKIWQLMWPYGASENNPHNIWRYPRSSCFYPGILFIWASERISEDNILLPMAVSLHSPWIYKPLDYEIEQSNDPYWNIT